VSEARTFKVKSSLAKQLFEPGGRLVRDAERLAGEALDTHRDEAMAMIAATLDELEAVCAEAAEGAGQRVYALGAKVIDLAAFFDTGPLHDAAWSLCEVSDPDDQRGHLALAVDPGPSAGDAADHRQRLPHGPHQPDPSGRPSEDLATPLGG
jgi:hypothetical protein